mmetsp:Transcript_33162/g.105780  ORF Transcript_33162/g.105780 Transcript_33162/m.105780 type:complete len:219 (-) Transcript_33162:117-773(-)
MPCAGTPAAHAPVLACATHVRARANLPLPQRLRLFGKAATLASIRCHSNNRSASKSSRFTDTRCASAAMSRGSGERHSRRHLPRARWPGACRLPDPAWRPAPTDFKASQARPSCCGSSRCHAPPAVRPPPPVPPPTAWLVLHSPHSRSQPSSRWLQRPVSSQTGRRARPGVGARYRPGAAPRTHQARPSSHGPPLAQMARQINMSRSSRAACRRLRPL